AADQRIPRSGTADRGGARQLPRRQPQGHRRDRGRAAGAGHHRGREHAVHVLPVHCRRQADPDHYLRPGHRPGQRPGPGAEPRDAHRAQAA
nr:hypothetical protein [Tanacetum cinerariifolium]